MKNILVIDDKDDLRSVIVATLTYAGYTVRQAANGRDGILMVLAQRPDLILCDVRMPEMDGYRTLAAIPDLLTALGDLNDRRLARSDRVADLRCLARWFAEAPDDDSAHRLWHAAFVLSPCSQTDLQAEAVLEYAIALSDSLALGNQQVIPTGFHFWTGAGARSAGFGVGDYAGVRHSRFRSFSLDPNSARFIVGATT